MVRVRMDSRRPVDRFDGQIGELIPTIDESGIEAVYLTESKELRAFLLTSPIVLSTQVRTLAAGVERLSLWRIDAKTVWVIALHDGFVSVFHNQELWTRYPSMVGKPVRAVPSADGSWIAVAGDNGAILWRLAPEWTGAEPAAPDAIGRETRLPDM